MYCEPGVVPYYPTSVLHRIKFGKCAKSVSFQRENSILTIAFRKGVVGVVGVVPYAKSKAITNSLN